MAHYVLFFFIFFLHVFIWCVIGVIHHMAHYVSHFVTILNLRLGWGDEGIVYECDVLRVCYIFLLRFHHVFNKG